MGTILVIALVVAVFIVGDLIRSRMHYEFYERDRTPKERQRATQLRTRAIIIVLAAIAVGQVNRIWIQSPYVLWLELGLFGIALAHALVASRRASVARTVAALVLVVTGGALLVLGVREGVVEAAAGSQGLRLGRLAGAVGGALVLFVAAARLARSGSSTRRPAA